MKILKITGLIILLVLLFFGLKKPLRIAYYDFLEYKFSRNTINWNDKNKLEWSDFNFKKTDDNYEYFFARVGIVNRYEFTNSLKIDFNSKTLFFPKDSYVSDTTRYSELNKLRARFDLCEIYRRKLDEKIRTLNFADFPEGRKDSVDLITEIFYNTFEKKWDELAELSDNEFADRIKIVRQKLNN
jgi:hypothetical protein